MAKDRTEPADFGALESPDGVLRPLTPEPWMSPGVVGLDGDRLRVSWKVLDLQRIRATAEVLDAFVALARGRGEPCQAVLKVARTTGVLSLCQHQLPDRHGLQQVPISVATPNATFEPMRKCRSLAGREPVSAWLYWAQQTAALLHAVERLRRGEPVAAADWKTLGTEGPWVEYDRADPVVRRFAADWLAALQSRPISIQRQNIADAITTWLRLTGTEVALDWSRPLPEVRYGEGTLMSAIAMGLILHATGSQRWQACPACGATPAPRKAGRAPLYCVECISDRVPQDRAQDKYRSSAKGRAANRARSAQNRSMARLSMDRLDRG